MKSVSFREKSPLDDLRSNLICINEEWRILYNHELKQRYHHANVVQKVRAKRLRWAGHVVRMEPVSVSGSILTTKFFPVIQLTTEDAVAPKPDGPI